jgi:hypothetical protein
MGPAQTIVTGLADGRAEADGPERPLLAEKAGERFKLRGRREAEIVGRAFGPECARWQAAPQSDAHC